MRRQSDRFKGSGIRKGARSVKENTAVALNNQICFYSCFEKDKGIIGLEGELRKKNDASHSNMRSVR